MEQDIEMGPAYGAVSSVAHRVNASSPNEVDSRQNADTLFFTDCKRRVDFVLVYQTGSRSIDQRRAMRRANLEDFLKKEGLQFEIDVKPMPAHLIPSLDSINHKLRGRSRKPSGDAVDVAATMCFMKIHATWDMLTKYADFMKMKMPLIKGNENLKDDELLYYFPNPFRVDQNLLPPVQEQFTSFFSKPRMDQFHIADEDSFFAPAQRSQIVWECLSRVRYNADDAAKYGIQRLLANGTFAAAYPLHDGSLEGFVNTKPPNLRAVLYNQWAQFRRWYKIQPIAYIKTYFGERIAFFFAWMEFYTAMLIPPTIVGLVCFIYGAATLAHDPVTNSVCYDESIGNITMCPLCDKWCPFWKLKDSCALAKATYLFDNPATMFFSAFMALWATMFLELWKRRESVVAWNFDTLDALVQYEPVRAELGMRMKNVRINPVTNVPEPYVPQSRRLMNCLLSTAVVTFMVFVVLAFVFGTVVYRMSVVVALYSTSGKRDTFASRYATYITSITSALLNLIVILIMERVYYRLAKWLTEVECPRTQTEYEDSMTWKCYIFEFVNCYSSLVYVAFFKGRVPASYPGSKGWFNVPVDQCDQAGCIIELCIQLAVILLGKQLYSMREAIFPFLHNWNQNIMRFFTHIRRFYRWEKDFQLRPFPALVMFKEYSRMVLQFGFMTTFGVAFPLAPLFVLFISLFEIRFDAYKLLVLYRRPVPQTAKNIGAWLKILQYLAQFSVVTNAFVISFTSEFVPKMAYKLVYSPDGTLNGYIPWCLSAFAVEDFPASVAPMPGVGFAPLNYTTECYYRDFREGPSHDIKYSYSMVFWHIFAARLALVIVLEHFILITTKVIAYMMPDMPGWLQAKILRQDFLAKEAFYDVETRKLSLAGIPLRNDSTQVSLTEMDKRNHTVGT